MIKAGQALTVGVLAANQENWWHAQKMGMTSENAAHAKAAEQ